MHRKIVCLGSCSTLENLSHVDKLEGSSVRCTFEMIFQWLPSSRALAAATQTKRRQERPLSSQRWFSPTAVCRPRGRPIWAAAHAAAWWAAALHRRPGATVRVGRSGSRFSVVKTGQRSTGNVAQTGLGIATEKIEHTGLNLLFWLSSSANDFWVL